MIRKMVESKDELYTIASQFLKGKSFLDKNLHFRPEIVLKDMLKTLRENYEIKLSYEERKKTFIKALDNKNDT